jgi:hypothetical protein
MRTRLPDPWRRIDNGAHGKCGARYVHPSGYWIEHCGHPTALWPYALYDHGRMVLAPNGRAWPNLNAAAAEVARRLWKGAAR